MYFHTSVTLGLLAITQLVAGHGAIIKAVGDAGGAGSAIGIDPNTPRDGSKRNPFQADSTRFKNEGADTCGETIGAGTNNIQTGAKAVLDMNGGQFPQVSAGGQLMMTLHQVNGDGAGPYTCELNADGTAQSWTAIDVGTNIPGTNSRSKAKATDFPLTVSMPAAMQLTGNVAGQPNTGLVRCMNTARAGPFGGCIPVQAAGGAAPAAGAAAPAANGAASAAGAAPAAASSAVTKRKNIDDAEYEELVEEGDI